MSMTEREVLAMKADLEALEQKRKQEWLETWQARAAVAAELRRRETALQAREWEMDRLEEAMFRPSLFRRLVEGVADALEAVMHPRQTRRRLLAADALDDLQSANDRLKKAAGMTTAAGT